VAPRTSTRTALLEAPRRFAVVDRPIPVAAPDEVVVRIAATAVCHTDLSIYTGAHPGVRYPVVMGHESTGVIDAIGPEVEGLAPGQPVIINPIISCGQCDSCVLRLKGFGENGVEDPAPYQATAARQQPPGGPIPRTPDA